MLRVPLAARLPPNPIAIAPVRADRHLCAPAVTMTCDWLRASLSPAASARGTASPSDITITIPRTMSYAVKYLSVWICVSVGVA